MKEFNEIIKRIGEELGIKVTFLSDNWLTVLEKDNQIHYIEGHKFDLNNHALGNILDDKGLFNDVMVYKGIPCIKQITFYKKYDKEQVLNYFNKHHNTLIVKGNLGTCGNSVYLVKNKKDLFNKMDRLLEKQDTISISPYYQIRNEYRVILLNNEVRVLYGKIRPIVIGNGINTVGELAIKFNKYYEEHLDKIVNPNYIPSLNEEIELDFRFNLSNGAILFTEIDDELKTRIIDIAYKVTKSLNITFASVDIIHTIDDKLLVLEANSGIMMNNYIKLCKDGYNNAYNLYKDAIKLMFKL